MMESEVTGNCHASFGERDRETRELEDLKVRSVPTLFSPLLANIALHGMEERIKKFAKTIDIKRSIGKGQKSWQVKCKSLSLIRYADDFVILHEDLTVVQRCKKIISEWLQGMGLELKPSKTRLAHTLNQYEQEKPGFNFLGFTIQQFPQGMIKALIAVFEI